MPPEQVRSYLRTLFAAAIDAVDPAKLITRRVRLEHNRLIVRTQSQEIIFPLEGRIFVIGAGKGAGFLAQGLESLLGERIVDGVIVLPHGQDIALHRLAAVYAEHPLPGPGSLAGAARIATLLTQKQPQDLVCFCLTGGASSLLVSPAPGLSLEDKVLTNNALIACGADIAAINTVRKHLSQIKGGGLARWVFPSSLVSFILSDVIGDDLSTIGSGPTVPDPTTFADAWRIVEQFNLLTQLPSAVIHHLSQGLAGLRAETPKPGDPIFANVSNILIGSNRLALEAAAAAARSLGFSVHIVDELLSGDTTQAALSFAERIRSLLATRKEEPLCLLAGGETTVQVKGTGKGGRNQEFTLVVAHALQNETGWALLSAGTDGIDGPTDAAGAFADSQTIARAKAHNLEAQTALKNNDSYPFFAAIGELFCPGQTGTNVMDIKIALLWS
jgi:glycerate 2-kinase